MSQEASRHYGRKIDKCTECGSINIVHDYDTGETVCGDCGIVFPYKMLDRGPEWRAFDDEQKAKRSRTGAPTSYSVHDKNLATTISRDNRDAFGRPLSLNAKQQAWRLRKWNIRTRVHTSVDRNLAEAMTELDRLCDNLYIPPPIKEKAAIIYRKALDARLIRGRSIHAMTAAALYTACRETGTQRTDREIAEKSLVDKRDLDRCYRLIIKELDKKMPVADSRDYISKIAEPLGISGITRGVAARILQEAKKKGLQLGKSPIGFAGTALYCAGLETGERIGQRRIAEIANVTEVTLRNRLRDLENAGVIKPASYYKRINTS